MCKTLQEAHCSWVQSFTCSLLVRHLKILCSHGSKAIKDALVPRLKRQLQKCFALAMKIENKAFGNIVMGERKKANSVNLLALNTPAAWIPVQLHWGSKWPWSFEGLVESLCVLQGHQAEFLWCYVPFLSFWLSTEKAREEGKPFWDAHRAQKVEREKHWAASGAVSQPALGIQLSPTLLLLVGSWSLYSLLPGELAHFSQLLGQLTAQNLAIPRKLVPFHNCLLHIFPSLASKEGSI